MLIRWLFAVMAILAPAAAAFADDYPIGTPETVLDANNRIGAFRAWDRLFPVRVIGKATRVSPLPAGEPLVLSQAIRDFLRRSKATGLLVLQDGKIRYENYWLGASRRSRFTSMSLAKSLTAVLLGFAVRDGFIRSIDDPVTDYLPELKSSGYDGVPIAAILQMSSGVGFDEAPGSYADAMAFWQATAIRHDQGVLSWAQRLKPAHEAGTAFKYSGVDSSVIGLLVSRVTRKALADYAAEKLWQPAGMADGASWALDGEGHELPYCCFNATLEDYGRLGRFLLEDPGIAAWMRQSSAPHRPQLAPGKLYPGYPLGYGYQWWLGRDGYMGHGAYGQFIDIRPAGRTVIVLFSAWDQPWDYALEAEAHAAFDDLAAALK